MTERRAGADLTALAAAPVDLERLAARLADVVLEVLAEGVPVRPRAGRAARRARGGGAGRRATR
jgi:hypothetical protein